MVQERIADTPSEQPQSTRLRLMPEFISELAILFGINKNVHGGDTFYNPMALFLLEQLVTENRPFMSSELRLKVEDMVHSQEPRMNYTKMGRFEQEINWSPIRENLVDGGFVREMSPQEIAETLEGLNPEDVASVTDEPITIPEDEHVYIPTPKGRFIIRALQEAQEHYPPAMPWAMIIMLNSQEAVTFPFKPSTP